MENLARELKIDIGEVSKTGRKITSLGQESIILGKKGIGEGIIEGLEKQNVLAKNIRNIRPELLESAGMTEYFKKTDLPEISRKQIDGIKKLIKGLSKKEQLTYCSYLSRGGLPGNCAAAIDANPVKAAEVFAGSEATTGAMAKVKNASTKFLSLLGRGGLKAAPLAAIAAVGAAAEPLVKQFRNDDPTTYLSNPEQQKGML